MSVHVAQDGKQASLRVDGNLTLAAAGDVYAAIDKLAHRPNVSVVRIDLSRVEQVDSAGVITVSLGCALLTEDGKVCEVVGVRPAHQAAFRLFGAGRAVEPPMPRRRGFAELVGTRVLGAIETAADFARFALHSCYSLLKSLVRRDHLRGGAIVEQASIVGADAVGIVLLLGTLIGVVLAFQGVHQLEKFGAKEFMAEVVSLGMVREFGAVITAVIVAGRSGAAMSAELGTMKVNEEIDALEGMGIDPASFLVIPRIAALTLAMPLLSLMSMAIGIGSGIGIATLKGLPAMTVFLRMQEALLPEDFAQGVLKSFLFAWIIGFTSCFVGLRTGGGAQGVGQSATRAVVASIVGIIIVDSTVTTVWTLAYD
jgi:phospholipid/cholesterol/gamma-HCH transport system permease protein